MKTVFFLVTLLLICILVPLQKVSAQTAALTVVGDSAKTTTTAGIDDITFTVRVSHTGDGKAFVAYYTSVEGPEGTNLTPLFPDGGIIGKDSSYDVQIVAPRWNSKNLVRLDSTEWGGFKDAGTYTITFEAQVTEFPPLIPIASPRVSTTLTLTVEEATVQEPSITVEGVDGLTRTSTTNDTENITYTFRITNVSDASDEVHLALYRFDTSDPTMLSHVENYFDVKVDFDTQSFDLEPGMHQDVVMTISRYLLLKAGIYTVSIYGYTSNNTTNFVTVDTTITITDTPTPTNPTVTPGITEDDESLFLKVVFSEIMFESEGGNKGLPQWLEIYNSTNSEVNLRGWKLRWKRLQPHLLDVTTTFKEDFIIPRQQSRLIVTALGRHTPGGNLSDDAVYQLQVLHADELAQDNMENRNQLLTRGGFFLELLTDKDEHADFIGTLQQGTDLSRQYWELPTCLIDGVRSSLIRRFDGERGRRLGDERRGWIRAYDAKRIAKGIYYGSLSDLGTPGYRRGKPLPVELSQFTAKFVKDEVVINWTTESELNNAGFNIYRSTSRAKDFQRINTKLIQGAGTTGQRSTYQFIDKTAQPDISYYYRLEDVELSGTRGILTTYRLRGVIAPDGKRITTWGTLKDVR